MLSEAQEDELNTYITLVFVAMAVKRSVEPFTAWFHSLKPEEAKFVRQRMTTIYRVVLQGADPVTEDLSGLVEALREELAEEEG